MQRGLRAEETASERERERRGESKEQIERQSKEVENEKHGQKGCGNYCRSSLSWAHSCTDRVDKM